MSAAFSVLSDGEGNRYMMRGPVIAKQAVSGPFYIGSGGMVLDAESGGEFAAAGTGGASYEGGSGTNLSAGSSPLGTLVPYGKIRATGPNSWETTDGGLTVTFVPGDGHSEIHDGTDVVAVTGPGGTIAPYGTFNATPYGEATYGGGGAWSVNLEYEGAANPFPARAAIVVFDVPGAQSGSYMRASWNDWQSADDPLWTIGLDLLGDDILSDGTDIVASRPADPQRPHDPSGGDWLVSDYGRATYGNPISKTEGTGSGGTFPEQDWALVATEGAVEYWAGVTFPTLFVVLDTGTGDAVLKDGTDTVGERPGGSTATPDGSYIATPYGVETYGGGAAWIYDLTTTAAGEDFTVRIGLGRAPGMDGVMYVTLHLDALTDELLMTSGPDFAALMPTSTATEFYWPVYEVSGGVATQIQFGPIEWVPRI